MSFIKRFRCCDRAQSGENGCCEDNLDRTAYMLMNVLWFFVGGIWIWFTHIFYGLIFCITIIGIPFGKMHFRLAKLALSPFGKELG